MLRRDARTSNRTLDITRAATSAVVPPTQVFAHIEAIVEDPTEATAGAASTVILAATETDSGAGVISLIPVMPRDAETAKTAHMTLNVSATAAHSVRCDTRARLEVAGVDTVTR